MMRTASMRLDVSDEQTEALAALRTVYADVCNRLVPVVRDHRLWNRVGLHQRAYNDLREATLLGSQMCCDAIYSVCKAYKSQKKLGCISKDSEVPAIRFDHASVHFDKRTCTLKGDSVSLYTLSGRITVALRRCLQSNGSQSAKQKLRQVSGKEMRRVKHINHETSQAIVAAAKRSGVARIAMEDLTHIRKRIKTGKRMRGRLHRWAWRQLQTFVEYKAKAGGIAVEYVNPAYTSQTCSCCGALGKRVRHRFVCGKCGLRAHADLNASRNLARIGSGAPLSRAAVNTPDVGSVDMGNHVCISQ